LRVRALIAALGIGLCGKAGATTIVAIWTPSRIVIAGDSLVNVNWTTANGATHHRTKNDCKIRKFGSNYIAAAGNYRIQTTGFDVWETAARACGSPASVSVCANAFSAELRRMLAGAVRFREVYLSVLVAGYENGAPALEHITLAGKPSVRLSVQSESFRRGRQNWGRVILGERGAIDRYERGSASTMSQGVQEQALSLVRVEAQALPQEIGAPFSVLTIGPSGERWINPGCCPSSCSK
jgi:hypothetical protein